MMSLKNGQQCSTVLFMDRRGFKLAAVSTFMLGQPVALHRGKMGIYQTILLAKHSYILPNRGVAEKKHRCLPHI